jgi:hypothetical protein
MLIVIIFDENYAEIKKTRLIVKQLLFSLN